VRGMAKNKRLYRTILATGAGWPHNRICAGLWQIKQRPKFDGLAGRGIT
jgi:hypothetical protein